MKKESSYKLETSESMIKECIKDIYINPRNAIIKWSKITNQTAQGRFAYPSQHLDSLITGIKGRGTAARGDDLADGSEVKSCSRADQLSECKKCKSKVLVWQDKCSSCGSSEINIKEDSHWIFSIKSKNELDLLLNKIPRIILILFDKPENNKDDIQLRVWEISSNILYVKKFFENYFYENYSKKNNPAPCNLHPLKYDFYLMKPKLIFYSEINIKNADTDIFFWNLDKPRNEEMPLSLLNKEQLIMIFGKKVGKMKRSEIIKKFKTVPYRKIDKLSMKRKILKTYKKAYSRR